MLTRTFGALALATCVMVAVVAAQTNATLTLKSGEQVSAQLVDMNASAFTVRVNGQERKISVGDVSLIDFGGGSMSNADWDRVSGGQHAIWLRSGEVITGRLYDIAGSTPKRLMIKTDGGERTVSSDEVSRVAMARPTSGGTPSTPGSDSGITVQGNQAWTSTGLVLRNGERITVKATGEVRLSSNADDIAGPSGALKQRFDPRAPLPNTLAGALIGRIGNGKPFGIGADNTFQADGGQLFLGINDSNVADNQGAFQVEIQRSGGTSRRR
jgi:hypothetical protein